MVDLLKRYPAIIAISTFVISTLIFFAPTIILGKVPLPIDLAHDYLLDDPKVGENGLIRDSVVQMYPNLHVMFTAYKAGDFSSWNPYIFGGIDMQATGQSTALSPLNIFIPLFGTSLQFFSFVVIFYFLLSGIAMYVFLRGLGHTYSLATLGGIVFQMSGPLLGWMAWGTISGVMACVPLMLLAVHMYAKKRQLGWLVLLTIANYTSLTAGHLQFYLYGIALVVVYASYQLWQHRADMKKMHWIALAGVGTLNAVIVFLITKPFLQAIALSHRTELTDVSRLSVRNLMQFIHPNIWGDVNNYTGPLNYLESMVTVSFLPVLLVIAVLFFRKFVQWKKMWFWAAVIVITLLYNLVPEIVKPVSYFLPFLNSFPPFRSLFIIDIAIIVITVHVLQDMMALFKTGQNMRVVYLLILIWTNQYLLLGDFTPQQDPAPLQQPPAYVTFLQNQGDKPLIYSELSPLNVYSLYGIRSIFGYDSNYPESYYQQIKHHGEIISDRNILNATIKDREFLAELGVEYIVTKRELNKLDPVFDQDGIKIYQL